MSRALTITYGSVVLRVVLTVMDPSMMLSSQATPTFSRARVTTGQTSRRYFSRYWFGCVGVVGRFGWTRALGLGIGSEQGSISSRGPRKRALPRRTDGPWGRAWRRRTPRAAGPACARASTPPPSSGRCPRGPTACPAGTASSLHGEMSRSIDRSIQLARMGKLACTPAKRFHTITIHPSCASITPIINHPSHTRARRLPVFIRPALGRRGRLLPLVIRHGLLCGVLGCVARGSGGCVRCVSNKNNPSNGTREVLDGDTRLGKSRLSSARERAARRQLVLVVPAANAIVQSHRSIDPTPPAISRDPHHIAYRQARRSID